MRVKCAAHLGQIGTAIAMYGTDHKGALPVGEVRPYIWWPGGYHWFEHIAPYLQNQHRKDDIAEAKDRSVIWGCPEWEGKPDPRETWAVGYTYNVDPLLPAGNPGRDVMWIAPAEGKKGRYFTIWQVPNRTERGMVTDGNYSLVSSAVWRPSKPIEKQPYGTITPTRHGKWQDAQTINVLYFAGHVRAISPKQVLYAFNDPLRSMGW